MKLRLLDLEDDLIQVDFDIFAHADQQDSYHKQFQVDLYDSPFYQGFKQDLAWYFADFPLALEKSQFEAKSSEIVQKLIKFGQGIADELIGEDFELINIKERIEKLGYPQLTVVIESKRAEFFTEMWEALILPESNYMLSCVSADFSRRFVDDTLEAVEYQLEVTPQQNQQVAAMLGKELGEQQAEPVNNPLIVAKWLAQLADHSGISNHLALSRQAREAGQMIEFNLHQLDNSESLSVFADHHLVHYHGPLTVSNGELFFSFNGDTSMCVAQLADHLVELKVPCLMVQISEVKGSNESFELLMAKLAQSCQLHGLGNVIVLSQFCSSYVADTCFSHLYQQIAKGHTLARAVVEARKALQANVQIQLVETEMQSFHPWPLLQHYSIQSVKYFVDNAPQPEADAPNNVECYQKLLGFKGAYMPPLLYATSDHSALAVLNRLSDAHQAVLVHGEKGRGKTQLAHVVAMETAANQSVDWCFYFDLAEDIDSPLHIRQMIAPVLELATDENGLAQVDERLATLNCLFVFDNANQLNQALHHYVVELSLGQNHQVLLLAEQSDQLQVDNLETIAIADLTQHEQHMLLAECSRQLPSKPALTEQSTQWLSQVDSHPWLIEKLTPLVAAEVECDFVALANAADKPAAFYQSQWDRIDPHWQKLLILCFEQRGLLLEMLMIAMDQQKPIAACQSLMSLFGVDLSQGPRFFDAINQWQQAGMVTQLPHGRMLDLRAKAFVNDKREWLLQGLSAADQQLMQLNFSQLICEGVRLLSTHMVKEPNPNITNNLLLNRSQWVKHFENLWFNQDYRGFMGVKQVFDQLLVQAKIGHESHQWANDLIERSDSLTLNNDVDAVNEAGLSYLALAASALTQIEQAQVSDKIKQAAQVADVWLQQFKAQLSDKQLPLFQQVTVFLEQFYARQQQWSQAIEVVKTAEQVYFEHQAWHRVIACNKSLAQYYQQNEQADLALACDQRILEQVPYEGAPAGFKQQQMIDIVLGRIGRKAPELAQALLDQIKQELAEGSNEALQMAPLIDGLQCDIYFLQQKYRLAMPLFCRTWAQAQANPQQLAQLKPRMLELKQQLGDLEFDQVFADSTPIGCVHPDEIDSIN